MMKSWLQELLDDKNISTSEKEKIILEHFNKEDETKEKKKKGYFDFPEFDADKEKIYKECEMDYPKRVWNKLEQKSQIEIKNAYVFAALVPKLNDDESNPISKLAKTIEIEIKIKLFNDFVSSCTINDANNNNETDRKFAGCIAKYKANRECILTLGQMLTMIKESSYTNTNSNYSDELYNFLMKNLWDVDYLYDTGDENNFYLDYPKCFRNESVHGYISERKTTEACKAETKEIISWIMNSYNSKTRA